MNRTSMKYSGLLFLICLSFSHVSGQDLILLRNDQEIISRVTDMERWHVFYKPFNDLEGEKIRIPKAEIAYILFEDGMRQYFSAEDLPPVMMLENEILPDSLIDADLYSLGREHAAEYYQRRASFWGTFGATVFYPFVGIFTGLITGVIVGAIPPSINMEDVPDPAMFQGNPSYAQGFRDQAQRNKVKEVVKGYGIGVGLQGVLLVMLIASGF